MFEKEIKFIGDFCFNQVKSLGTNFTLDKVTTAGVHPAVSTIHFCRTRLYDLF